MAPAEAVPLLASGWAEVPYRTGEFPWPGGDDPLAEGGGFPEPAPRRRLSPLAERLWQVLRPPPALLLADHGPLAWPQPLLPYQRDGVRALIEHDSLLLADDPGLGKTIMTLAALRVLVRRYEIGSALVVVPAGLVSQWRAEFRRWAPDLRLSTVRGAPADRRWQWRTPAHAYLAGYETLRADTEPGGPAAGRRWDLVVLDEAQRIKNADTGLSHACKRLPRDRQWALTGTPLENRTEDLVSLLDFVAPIPGRSRAPSAPPGELRHELARVQLRRRRDDVLPDLPPKLVIRVPIALGRRQRATYERAEREGIVELRARGEELRIGHVLELITRLKQICNVCPATGESAKLADMEERVAAVAAAGHKALVFSQFVDAVHGARAVAARLGPGALVYAGDLGPAERDETLARFRADPAARALVLSVRAGGQGLNLQEASYVVHFDRWWNPATERQAEARSHRMGQRRPVNVYAYVCEGTIEERIEAILREKQLLFDELVDGVSIDLAARLTAEEVYGLVGLAPPRPAAGRAARRPTAPATGGLAERIAGRLRADGWETETPGPEDGALVATRFDDLGLTTALRAVWADRTTPLDAAALDRLTRNHASPAEGRLVAVCPAGFAAEARALAEDRGVALRDGAWLAE